MGIITREVTNSELKEVVNKLIPDTIADDIRKACTSIYPLKDVHIRKACTSISPLKDVHIRKVKVLKKPRFDLSKLMEIHGEGGRVVAAGEDVGSKVDRPDNYEPPVLEAV